MNIKNKVAVITGSTRGFGYTIAQEMLKAGASVVIGGRSEEALGAALQSLGSQGQVAGSVCDVRKEAEVYALARFAFQKYGRIDIWVNNAGYSAAAGMMMDLQPAQAIDMFLANDMGTLYRTQAALHFMLPRKEGVLVNVYGAGSNGKPSSPTGLYGATKAWVTSFTRTLSVEIRGSGVTLLGFSPGMMLTDMLISPTVVGERGKEGMKNFGFVLRLLGKAPEESARALVKAIETNKKEFAELRVSGGKQIMLNLLKIKWEDWRGTGKAPEFKLKMEEGYKPQI